MQTHAMASYHRIITIGFQATESMHTCKMLLYTQIMEQIVFINLYHAGLIIMGN